MAALWVAAYTGESETGVEIRVADLRVRTLGPAPAVATAAPRGRMRWLATGLLGAALIVIGFAWWRRRAAALGIRS